MTLPSHSSSHGQRCLYGTQDNRRHLLLILGSYFPVWWNTYQFILPLFHRQPHNNIYQFTSLENNIFFLMQVKINIFSFANTLINIFHPVCKNELALLIARLCNQSLQYRIYSKFWKDHHHPVRTMFKEAVDAIMHRYDIYCELPKIPKLPRVSFAWCFTLVTLY